MKQRGSWHAFGRLGILLATFTLSGCGYSSDQTVTLKIRGDLTEAKRDKIAETLKGMTDDSSHSYSGTWTGTTMSVSLAPVADVDAFAKKIEFGEVTSIEGRTIHVAVGDQAKGSDGPPKSVDSWRRGDSKPQAAADPTSSDAGGSSAKSSQDGSARGYASPQAAFAALKRGFANKEWNVATGALTDEAQRNMAGALVMVLGFTALDESKRPQIMELFDKHGLDTDDGSAKEQEDKDADDAPTIVIGPDGGPSVADVAKLAEPIANKQVFLADAFTWLDEQADGSGFPPPPARGELIDVQIDGDSARGTLVQAAVTNVPERKEPIEFRKFDGRWLIHLSEETFDVSSSEPLSEPPLDADFEIEFPGTQPEQPAAKLPPVEIPDKPVSGTLFGKEFQPDRYELSHQGILKLRQGDDFLADAEILLFLFPKEGQPLAGQTWNIGPDQEFGGPHIHAKRKHDDDRKTEIVTSGYRLQLELKESKDGKIAGRIYLKLPEDEVEATVAGTFTVEQPYDPDDPPTARQVPYVQGKINVADASGDWLRAGYVGVTNEGKAESNTAGTKITVDSSTGWVQSTTYKPRITAIRAPDDGTATFRHLKLTPGTYFIYAKWGEDFLAGEWHEVAKDAKLDIDIKLDAEATGSLTVTTAANRRRQFISLLPLNEQGEIPQAAKENAFSLSRRLLSKRVENDEVHFKSLKPGRYRVFLGRDKSQDVTVTSDTPTNVRFE